MDFNFTEDQLLFRDSVRDFLRTEITPEKVRELWEGGRSDELWAQLAELGLVGITVPEEHGGLGMSELDFVLLAEECGYVALPEPLVQTALVAVPTLVGIGGDLAAEWLPKIAAGEARVIVGVDELVEDADGADLLLLSRDGVLQGVEPSTVTLRQNDSVDPSRRLFAVEFDGGEAVGDADTIAMALDRGALGCAAQALGLAQRMVDLSVAYTSERKQFGKPIGAFQAVKHHMATVAVRLEYARAPVYRAAWSLANGHADASRHASHAKLAACEAAALAAKNSIQVHGAMGYTWEVDLHIYMKKAWALAGAWGDTGYHKQRVSDALFEDGIPLGAGATF
jgi:alkylation response protein AidB-like acyl-CoA dehydrogenase